MFRNCILKVASAFLSAALIAGVFGIGVPVYADETETNVTSTTEDEEIDPSHLKFVARLYSIVTRQDRCDPEEKANLAENLKDGIDAAYSIMYHFYFSDTYRALDISDEQFIEDLYVGCYGRYADDNDKNNVASYLNMLSSGMSRYLVFREFISSNEFVSLCKKYDIKVREELVEDISDHKYGMTSIGDDYYDFDKGGNLSTCYKGAGRHLRNLNEQLFRSSTKYYILADMDYCYLMIFKGSVGNWKLHKIYPMTCGRKGVDTPAGTYKVTKKSSSVISKNTLYYYSTQFGSYSIQSIPYNKDSRKVTDGRIGKRVNGRSIRVTKDHAKWIYKNIPKGTSIKIV